MSILIQAKRRIANYFFKDVMDSNARKYLEYHSTPSKGIRELYSIAKHRILEDLNRDLKNGNCTASLFDPLYQFYVDLLVYDFDSLTRGIAGEVANDIQQFEANNPGQLVDKERLYFLLALVSVASGNTISATMNWELALAEAHRRTGTTPTVTSFIGGLPNSFTTLLSPVKHRHATNPLIASLATRSFMIAFEPQVNSLSGLDALSLLSSGLRNVHVNTLFDSYGVTPEVPRMYGQELINNLSVLNESLLKEDSRITSQFTMGQHMMIGGMLDKIQAFNPGVYSVLGRSFNPKSGLYVDPALDFSTDVNFNANYPTLIDRIENGGLSDDEVKAHILFGLHSLRNRVLHDLNPNLVYYQNQDLFVKTIGLLFASISVIKSL